MWTNQYIGIPYKANGRDRSGLDCWGLARLIYQEEYRINLPSFSTEYTENDADRMAEIIAQYREGWRQVDKASEGDMVLFRMMGAESHIGVAIDEHSFIHVREGADTCIEKFDSPRWKHRVVGFFKYDTSKGAIVNALPYPLKTERVTIPIPGNTKVSELVHWIEKEYVVSEELTSHIVVLLNSIPINKSEWDTTIIGDGDVVEYRVVPAGGRSNPLRTLAFVALVVYAPVLAGYAEFAAMPYVTSTFASSAIYAAAYAGTIIAGSALINSISPVRPPELTNPTDPGTAERMYMLDGAQNQSRLYDAIPVVLGKVKMTPPIGANNFTQYLTEREQYLSGMLVWGYGPLVVDHSTLKIGDTPWSSYTDAQIVTLDRRSEALTAAKLPEFNKLYGSDIEQIYKNITLTAGDLTDTKPAPGVDYTGDNTVVTVFDTAGADTVSITIHFSEGLRRVSKTSGDSSGVGTVKFKIERSLDGGLTWSAALPPSVYRGNSANWSSDGAGIFSLSNSEAKKDAFSVSVDFSNTTTTTGTVGLRITRMTSSTKENSDYYYYYTSTVQSVQKVLNSAPSVDPVGVTVAKSAFQIKASGQVSGRLEGISAIVQTYARTWNGTDWSTLAATNNPAALFLYVITHPGNPQRILPADESTQIDWSQLQYWYSYCATKGFQFNTIIGSQKSVLEVLRDICAAGRASPALVNGKWTVTIDEPKSIIAQHFSPHNSWGFESTKNLPKVPDGVKVKFFDEDNDYQENEVTIYNNGKTYATATLFESITLPGITKKSLVIDHAKWHLSQAKVRPEVYTLNTDIEYLVCTRGDRVKVAHFVPMWGIGSGRIKNRITSYVYDLDEPISIDDINQDHILRVRGKANSSVTASIIRQWSITNYVKSNGVVTVTLNTTQHPFVVGDKITTVVNVGGVTNSNLSITNGTITAVTATTVSYLKAGADIASATPTTSYANITASEYSRVQLTTSFTQTQVDAGDLFLFGLNQKESQDLIILSIEPTTNKTARLTLVDYGVTSKYNLFTDYPYIVDTSAITYTAYSINIVGGISYVTLTIGNHPVKVGDKITVPNRTTATSPDSTLSVTNETVTSITSTTITYMKPLLNATQLVDVSSYPGTVSLVGGITFESNITPLPYNYRNTLTDQVPIINNIVSDESVLEVVGPGSFITKMVVSIAPAADNRQLPLNVQSVEVEYDYLNTNFTAGTGSVIANINSGKVEIPMVDEGKTYKLRARYVSASGTTGNWSAYYTHTVVGKTSLPKVVENLSNTVSQTSGIVLTWSANTEKDLFGYEIRTSNAGWGSATGYVWKGQATKVAVPITSNMYGTTTTYYIKAIDYNNNYSATATSTQVSFSNPEIPTGLNYTYGTSLTTSTVTVYWTAPVLSSAAIPIKNYKFEIVKPNGVAINPIFTDSTSVTIAADWLGDATVKVTPYNLLGVPSSTYAQILVSKVKPNPVTNAYASVVDNNILMYWTLPVQTSLPISHIKITKGASYNTSTLVGTKSGGFTSLFENKSGTYTYWLVAVDTDNRESEPVSVTKDLGQPPDFVLNLDYTSTFSSPTIVLSNAAIFTTTNEGTKQLLLLVNNSETWVQHFTNSSKTSIQQLIDAGNSYYVAPAVGVTNATYTEIVDVGTVLSSSSIIVTMFTENLIGSPTLTVSISTSINGTTWSTPVTSPSLYATDFKYVKITITAQENSSTDLVLIKSINIRLDSKLRNDAGTIQALASDASGTIANFTGTTVFADVTSITASANSTTPLITTYEFKDSILTGTYTISGSTVTVNVTGHGLITGQKVRLYYSSGSGITGVYTITKINDNSYTVTNPVTGSSGGSVSTYPQSMRIYVYNTSGVRQDCPQVSWSIKGY